MHFFHIRVTYALHQEIHVSYRSIDKHSKKSAKSSTKNCNSKTFSILQYNFLNVFFFFTDLFQDIFYIA